MKNASDAEQFQLRSATPADADRVAALFDDARSDGGAGGWAADAISDSLKATGSGTVAEAAGGRLIGAALAQVAVDDADLLNIAVLDGERRRGVARALLNAVKRAAAAAGAHRLMLEVAVDNVPALSFYLADGARAVGLRRAYYRRGAKNVDAQILAFDLESGPLGSKR